MKKYLFAILSVFCFLITANTAQAKKEVVIFSQPCQFCEKMKEALNNGIIAANPDIEFTILDIQDEKNYRLLNTFAANYGLSGNIGLPILFIGENYMMGWGPNAPQELQNYIEIFKKETITRIPTKVMLQQ